MTVALVLDVVIAVLLVMTIVYAMRLNGRLTQLRKDKAELESLARTFAAATISAESSIKKLKVSAESLKDDVHKAEVLKDDLVYLIERGGASADEMMERVNVGRTPPRTSSEPDSGPPSPFGVPGGFDGDMTGGAPARPRMSPGKPLEPGHAHDAESDAERVLMKVLGAAG